MQNTLLGLSLKKSCYTTFTLKDKLLFFSLLAHSLFVKRRHFVVAIHCPWALAQDAVKGPWVSVAHFFRGKPV